MKKLLIGIAVALPLFAAGVFYSSLRMKQIATPANPASGENKLYFKSDDKLYKLTSAGVEAEIGAGGGGVDLSNPANYPPIAEEFQGGTSASHQIGSYGWAQSTFASGTVDQNGTPLADVPGYVAGAAHNTNADSGAVIQYAYVDPSMILNNDWVWAARVKLGSTSNSRTWVGPGATAGIVPARFIGLRYDTSSSYADDTKNSTGRWVAQMCVSSGCTDTGGTYVVTAVTPNTSFHIIKITKVGSTYTMYYDGTSRATFCASGCDTTVTSLNGNVYQGFFLLGFESGASFMASYVDWFYFSYSPLSR